MRTIDFDAVTHKAASDYMLFTGQGSGAVFRGKFGQRLNHNAGPSRIAALMQLAGLEYGAHALRHFAGSLWILRGDRIEDVSPRLGHKSYEFTRKIYIRELEARDTLARRAMQNLNKALPGVAASLPPPVTETALPINGSDIAIPPAPRIVDLSGITCARIDVPDKAPQWVYYATRLFQAGCSVNEVGDALGVSRDTLFSTLKNNGLPTPGEIFRGSHRLLTAYTPDTSGQKVRDPLRINDC